jgi:ribonuclease BN (tRNA processing enzyme)
MGQPDRDRLTFTVAGSGTVVPESDRVCSGYFLEGRDFRLLLDCGPGVVHHLARFDLDWSRITHLALTHFHNDHVGDVSTLLFALKYGLRTPRTEPLTVIGPAGTAAMFGRLAAALGDHVTEPGFPLRTIEIGDDGAADLALGAEASIDAIRTRHTDNSLAYRIGAEDIRVAYTGDTGYDEESAAFLAGADVLVMECSLPEDLAMDSHLTPRRVAAMATIARPRLLLLTHIYPVLDRERVPDLVRAAGWEGDIRIAHDGLRLTPTADASPRLDSPDEMS